MQGRKSLTTLCEIEISTGSRSQRLLMSVFDVGIKGMLFQNLDQKIVWCNGIFSNHSFLLVVSGDISFIDWAREEFHRNYIFAFFFRAFYVWHFRNLHSWFDDFSLCNEKLSLSFFWEVMRLCTLKLKTWSSVAFISIVSKNKLQNTHIPVAFEFKYWRSNKNTCKQQNFQGSSG